MFHSSRPLCIFRPITDEITDHEYIILCWYISMVYPTLNISSLSERCKSDLDQFYKLYEINSKSPDFNKVASVGLEENERISKSNIEKKISELFTRMKEIAKTQEFDYAHDVINLSDTEQKKLWVLRTFLFYQLLIVLTITLQNKQLYNSLYTDVSSYPFRDDLIPELENFKMGIFGSITPQSDIDIGIQYSGNTMATPGLAHVVSRFENLFVNLTGTSSLGFDIETYADMMTIPNTYQYRGGRNLSNSLTKKKPAAIVQEMKQDDLGRMSETTEVSPAILHAKAESLPTPLAEDYFYLDTSNFTEEHFQKVLVCAGTSILRNVLLYKMDVLGRPLTKEEVSHFINEFDFKRDAISLQPIFREFYQHIEKSLSNNWIDQAKPIVIDFMNSTYDQGRYEYYKLVNIAESGKFEATRNLGELGPDKICELVVNIGLALTYRMESYTCAPTVIHVVRILQASKEKAEKYKTLVPTSHCVGMTQHLDPFCTIGKYGYALSCLEQIGYIYRFHQTYCIKSSTSEDTSHYNEAKCAKKAKKYMGRVENGYFFYLQYTKGSDKIGGRKRKFAQGMLNKLRKKSTRSNKRKSRKRTSKNRRKRFATRKSAGRKKRSSRYY